MSDQATTIATAIGLLNAGDVDGYVTTLYTPEAVFHGFPPAFTPDRDGIAEFFRACAPARRTPTSPPRICSPVETG
jgi:ketosteroid isomerase-like protein